MSPERWAALPYPRQILTIAADMHRASSLFGPGDGHRLRRTYESVLANVDLTVPCSRAGRLRELLRFREVIASLWVATDPDRAEHRRALYCLLGFTAESFRQAPYLVPEL
ncbi:MAG: hypothetical protein U0166_25985, partial [Acidobacteriota bacterium]